MSGRRDRSVTVPTGGIKDKQGGGGAADFDPRQEEGGNKSGLATVLHFATSLSSTHGMLPIHQLHCRCGRTELQRLDARAIFLWSKRDPVRSLTFLTKVQTIAYNIRSAP